MVEPCKSGGSQSTEARQGEVTGSKPCANCPGRTESPEKVMDVLQGRWSGCADCPYQAAMQVVTKQFQMRQSRWWIVDSIAVVPVWMVEILKASRRI